ncbi:MAG: RDD family protein [Acidobacteria bacterium]|nr:RDD family protein [Acidobacteriota bacterium]
MAALAPSTTEARNIVDFSPEAVHAPFMLRCTSLCADYLVLLLVPVLWLILGKYVSDSGNPSLGATAWVLGSIVFMLNSLVLPMFIGKSIGKLLTGTTIVNSDGTDVTIGHILRRNVLGYAITLLTLGLGFISAAFSTKGRTLHDIVGGTIVVRARKVLVS